VYCYIFPFRKPQVVLKIGKKITEVELLLGVAFYVLDPYTHVNNQNLTKTTTSPIQKLSPVQKLS
jgi:hypothetical protein